MKNISPQFCRIYKYPKGCKVSRRYVWREETQIKHIQYLSRRASEVQTILLEGGVLTAVLSTGEVFMAHFTNGREALSWCTNRNRKGIFDHVQIIKLGKDL